jgi:hypothetical protein
MHEVTGQQPISPKYPMEDSISPNNLNRSNQETHNTTKCESISSNEKEIEYVRVIYPYHAKKSREAFFNQPLSPTATTPNSQLPDLTVVVNEILKLIEDDTECLDYDKSWLKVFNSQGITGIIPSNCVQPILDNQMSNFVFIRRPTTQGMFANNKWYFGNITRFETIFLFNKYAHNGDFLVRDSDVISIKLLIFLNY